MSKDYPQYIKQFANDVLIQSKPYYKRVKRLVIYKDNVPCSYNRHTGNWDYRLERNQ